jgi:hypothetical protein
MNPESFCGFSHAQAAVIGGCLFNWLCYSKQNSIIKTG